MAELLLAVLLGPPPGPLFEEKLLSTVPNEATLKGVVFAGDGKHVAFSAHVGFKQAIYVGRTRGEAFDEVSHPAFLPGRKAVYYKARRGHRWLAVADQRRSAEFDEIRDLSFGRRGEFIFRAREQDRWFGVIGETRTPSFPEIGHLYFPRGDGRPLFWAREDRKEFIVADGAAGPKYDRVSAPFFGAGGMPVYTARDGFDHFVVVGKEVQGPFHEIGSPVLTPDRKGVTYTARRYEPGKPPEEFIVSKGVAGPRLGEISQLAFTPGGEPMYHLTRHGEQRWVVAGERHQGFDEVGPPVFSPDGKRLAYTAREGLLWRVVLDERPGEPFNQVGQPIWRSDGRQLVYAARRGDLWSVVVDGVPGEPFGLVSSYIWFPPGGKGVGYQARTPHGWILVDGREKTEPYDWVGYPLYSPDGRSLAFDAVRRGRSFMVVDGRPGEPFESVRGAVWRPQSDGIAYVGMNGEEQFVVVGDRRHGPFRDVTHLLFSPDGSRVAFGARRGRELWWKAVLVE
jgi:hypothetical protein